MFGVIEFLFQSDFLREELFFFRKVLDSKLRERVAHFENFAANVKTLGVKREVIEGMIKKELMKNDFFTQRAQVLFTNEENMIDEEEESVINRGGGLLDSLLQEDIFFEIADHHGEDGFELDGPERNTVPKFENGIMVLNGVEKRLI